ncbi:unnamed protein product [Acanthoscelides obtectus]|uniref:Uncharacterized protein n=1 Tax=Acanthoscelides obtectus TaxID=200917 RepID=A0A9P0LJI2_ACAOB|nr:unnamed protein product [Acanthoscelides obtectus]CAK1641037.1 hypothetical protein AOBTE_LOCUS12101 [Acanthoscelides obtectus]
MTDADIDTEVLIEEIFDKSWQRGLSEAVVRRGKCGMLKFDRQPTMLGGERPTLTALLIRLLR